jgi:putative transposase
VAEGVERRMRAFVQPMGADLVELNIQHDHVHLPVMFPPKVSISEFLGTLQGRMAIRVFNKFCDLKKRSDWGTHFSVRGYFVDTVGLDTEKICKYLKYQEENDKRSEC